MAVFTKINKEELTQHLSQYKLGNLISFDGIIDGIINTNYKVETSKGSYILTIFEQFADEEYLQKVFQYTEHLKKQQFSCPHIYSNIYGEKIVTFKTKPSVIVEFLTGETLDKVSVDDCAALGESLANMHNAVQNFSMNYPNPQSLQQWQSLWKKCLSKSENIDTNLLQGMSQEIEFLQKNWPEKLPIGTIHGDLFPDNVFFMNGKVSGVIDFYFSSDDFYVYDLAMVVNAWAFDEKNNFNDGFSKAILKNYMTKRSLDDSEREVFGIMLRGSAYYITLMRLIYNLFPRDNQLLKPKDPQAFFKRLQFHRQQQDMHIYGVD